MNKRSVFALLLSMLLLGNVAQTASDGLRYRVAGIIQVSKEKSLAMIEASDDTQLLYRVGDMLGTAVIAGINQQGVMINIHGRSYVIELEGEPASLRDLELGQAGYNMQVSDSVGTYQINLDLANSQLRSVRNTPCDKDNPSDMSCLAERINDILHLPDGTRIETVENNKVDSDEDTLKRVRDALGYGVLRLDVSGLPGVSRVYVQGMDFIQGMD